jgi:hypothetical protein
MNTIVSAFITNVNVNPTKSIKTYIENGKLLLQANIPKIIFLDENIFDEFKNYSNELTKLIKIKKEEIYLYKYINLLENFNLVSTNPTKDTKEYMFIMCNKTEWIRQAIELNIFNTSNFIWIDFGIKHIFNCENDKYIKKIEILNDKVYDKIRIGHIWDLNRDYHTNLYNNISWYFAGGVFGGDIKSLLIFSEKTKEMCIKIIEEKHLIMWEVNVWYLVYKEMPTLFDFYSCDHNSSLIDNY